MIAIFNFRHAHSREDAQLLILGLFFTLVSDAFLLFSSMREVGIASFMFAHLCYIKRFRPGTFKTFLIIAVTGIIICLAGVLAGYSLPYGDMLGAVYCLLIFTATVTAFRSNLPKINKRLACAGMVLFILCDTNVAICNSAPAGSALTLAAFPLIYLFYIPSQAFLALSAGEYS